MRSVSGHAGNHTSQIPIVLVQEAEGSSIKEDEVRPQWNPAYLLPGWQGPRPRLDSLPKEMTAETAGTPAGSVTQKHMHVRSIIAEARPPDLIQQEAQEEVPVSPQISPILGARLADDMASSTPAGTQPKLVLHPADVLGYAMEMQLDEGEPGKIQPAASLQQYSEEEQLPRPEDAQASETSSGKACTEAVRKGSLSAKSKGVKELRFLCTLVLLQLYSLAR